MLQAGLDILRSSAPSQTALSLDVSAPVALARKRAHLRDAVAAVQGEAREGMPRERRYVRYDALVGQRLAPVQQQRGQARQAAEVPQACAAWQDRV